MPLPIVAFLALATGLLAALTGRVELRVTPRPAFMTHSFAAYALFVYLVLVPVGAYFYAFHGDWFLLYLSDAQDVPSALALIGFILLGGLGSLGFLTGAALVRAQRDGIAAGLAILALAGAGAVVLLAKERLEVVGTYAQYRGHFGLADFGSGALAQGAVVMGVILTLAFAMLLARLHISGRRGL